MKAAIYVRVSTGKQDIENQLNPLLAFAERKNFEVTTVYRDIASGKNLRRDSLKKMLEDAQKRKFEIILVWALDRLSREGLSKTIFLIESLNHIGVNVISYTEPYLDTTNEMAKNILLALLSTLASTEREKISERTKAGIARVRKRGVVVGRPKLPEKVRLQALDLLKQKIGVRETARRIGVSPMYISNLFKAADLKVA